MNHSTITLLAIATLFTCAACDNKPSGGHETPKLTASPTPVATAADPAPGPSSGPSTAKKDVIELQISSVGNEMKFDKTSLTVPAGAEVHLVIKNTGTMDTMAHNWVLVKTGTEAQVALDGLNKAPDAGYVAPGPDVYAFTPMAAAGKTAEVTFTAPAAGKYPYICTFPGHYLFMKGVLTVTP